MSNDGGLKGGVLRYCAFDKFPATMHDKSFSREKNQPQMHSVIHLATKKI